MFSLDNFEKTKLRFKAWWEHQVIDRVPLQVWAPKNGRHDIWGKHCNVYGAFVSYEAMKKWQDKNYDNEYLIKEIENILSAVYYAGDAFPNFIINLGPGNIAAYFGCDAEIKKDTVWFDTLKQNDWNILKDIKMDRNNKLWQVTKELTKAVTEKSAGSYFISAPDLGMGLDIASQIRGVQNLLVDLIDYPQQVKKLSRSANEAFSFCYSELYNIVKDKQKEFLGWIPVYNEGKNYPIQCDFSCMISPEMFLEFYIPELDKLTSGLDKVIYHLDGPGAVKHLDIILDRPEIDAIQWVPGDGAPHAVEWIAMLKKIQKKKALLVYAYNLSEVEKLLEDLEPEGLLISAMAGSKDEADYMVRRTEELSR